MLRTSPIITIPPPPVNNQFSWASPVAQEPNETLISRTNRSVVKYRGVRNGGGGGDDGDDVVVGGRESERREKEYVWRGREEGKPE